MSVPPSLKILEQNCSYVQIVHRRSLPLLERLYASEKELIDGREEGLLSSQSLKKLVIYQCDQIIPANIIPSTLEKLTIYNNDEDIFGQMVFPPSLTHLSLMNEVDDRDQVHLPETLVKLKYRGTLSLPQHLKKLVCPPAIQWYNQYNYASYPPNLEILDVININGDYTLDNLPPTIKHLSISLTKTRCSISERIPKAISADQQQKQPQWLPLSTTHLTCDLNDISAPQVFFRLDQVINHTNVRNLTLIDDKTTIQFSIQRLDPDNKNVLVLETKSLQGGIITQKRKSQRKRKPNNQQQQQQQQKQQKQHQHGDLPNACDNDPYRLAQWIQRITKKNRDRADMSSITTVLVKDYPLFINYKSGHDYRVNVHDMTLLLSVSNLLLLHIITSIDSNGDIICLLLTCKKLYNNSALRRSIQFKGIEAIDTNQQNESKQFKATATRFKLNSFKDILENRHDYPQWIQQRIYANRDRVDTRSGITTALATYDLPKPDSLYSMPSLETLIINNGTQKSFIDLTDISQLTSLQKLSINAHQLKLGPHPSLKSLTLDFGAAAKWVYPLAELGLTKFVSLTKFSFKRSFITDMVPGLLPSSLTSLSMRLMDNVPPRNTFVSLASLVKLKIDFTLPIPRAGNNELQQCMDLGSLGHLNKLKLEGNCGNGTTLNLEINLPPSLKNLVLWSDRIQIASHCTMPQLERLDVRQCVLMKEKVSLSSSPLIKKLIIHNCTETMPANIIPSSVEKLTIYTDNSDDILDQVVFPPSLTHLTFNGSHNEKIKLPESLVKLKYLSFREDAPVSLPRHLKKLVWGVHQRTKAPDFVFPSNYPPHLESLTLVKLQSNFTIPPITEYLSIDLGKYMKIYSITSTIATNQQQQPQQWLPPNTTHLTCQIGDITGVFRLDEIINRTNVRYLCLIIKKKTTFQLSIQRLDADNNNVLVLETNTLQGGIITQRKTINNSQQHQHPIYLHFNTRYSSFELDWTFSNEDVDDGDDE
ncbi:hypothetical protein DFA_08437 [Cavenderia fasciculata]|uniref:Uncharacterized protein n=1 Tax=Cavenderia fasciculata TaxID=261658 RepID=F4Q668_CACFS|nr:uncharacterized protein DFA_08437 [Cavenderia fasciculata]EGG17442.1 hypothetical protein DFA_08437 [Cavenderia fasciculata]|eukprot:XP_004355926.1 hypothetical protein DFA_08437 [Cavenderia fasciculata]